jgi:hypothetical protein
VTLSTVATLVLGGVLLALAILALSAVIRLARQARRSQVLSRFQRATADMAANVAREGNPLVNDLVDFRRRSADQTVVEARLATATPALRALSAHARDGLHAPPGMEPLAAGVAGEVSRALRSAELAQAGLDAMRDRRAGREVDASTSLKRATLNLRNAIDECARLAARIGELRSADLEHPGAVAGGITTASLPTYGSTEDDRPVGS